MEIFKGYKTVKQIKNPILTIGNFDGVHLGHQALLNKVFERAKINNGTAVVYTFYPHPLFVLNPEKAPELLLSQEEKREILKNLGVQVLIEEPFSREFSSMDATHFFEEVFLKTIRPQEIIVGYDFGFGKNREGSVELLKSLAEKKNILVHQEKPLECSLTESVKNICSSSKLRSLIYEGNVVDAKKMLGRPFFYSGIVKKGNQRGRTIGFPTANILVDGKIHVKHGVYATQVKLRGKIYPGVSNFGIQPTFQNSILTLETHILNFSEDIYGEKIEVSLISRIRDEKKFASLQELKEQIVKDVKAAKQILPS